MNPRTDVVFWALSATVGMAIALAIFAARTRFARPVDLATGLIASLGYIRPRAAIPGLPQPALGLPIGDACPGGRWIVAARGRGHGREPPAAQPGRAPRKRDGHDR